MSQATVDPTLESLVPRGSPWRSLLLVVLALVLLAGVWFLPPMIRPGVGTNPGGSTKEFAADKQVVLVAGIEPRAWGGVQVRAVEDLPGAHVIDAWAVDGDLWNGVDTPVAVATNPPAGTDARKYVAELGVTDADRLPRWVEADGDATLVVLWQIDDCDALTGEDPTVVVGNRWGASGSDSLRFSPFDLYTNVGDASVVDGPCSS